MADVHDKKTRSYNMSQIRSSNTSPEMKVRKFLFSKGLRFRINDKRFPGKPDLVLPKYKTVIFINGCFWHGHNGCKYFKLPKTRAGWWKEKIESNQKRDLKNIEALANQGWKVIVVWECDLKSDEINTLKSVYKEIKEGI